MNAPAITRPPAESRAHAGDHSHESVNARSANAHGCAPRAAVAALACALRPAVAALACALRAAVAALARVLRAAAAALARALRRTAALLLAGTLRAALAALLLAGLPARARGDTLALGVQLGNPGTGSGIELAGTQLPFGLLARYDRAGWPALSAGVGTPVAGVGISGWLGAELRAHLTPRLALIATPGLRTGLVGPGYYARHAHVFAGYAYNYAGPWTLAPRLPLGAAVTAGRGELFGEVFAEVPLWPAPELLVGAQLGVRIRIW